MEFMLKVRWQDLFYPQHEFGSKPKESVRKIYDYERMGDDFRKTADNLERVNKVSQIIEKAIRDNPLKNNLPF